MLGRQSWKNSGQNEGSVEFLSNFRVVRNNNSCHVWILPQSISTAVYGKIFFATPPSVFVIESGRTIADQRPHNELKASQVITWDAFSSNRQERANACRQRGNTNALIMPIWMEIEENRNQPGFSGFSRDSQFHSPVCVLANVYEIESTALNWRTIQ